ncbi:hypothetical protein JCM10908_005098 [Rhodotorula pacifica]|uniref:F-box protein n=1 Tax=Rhodotorula pacifica TaxID=1495444 RepID=UPI003180205A
MRSAMRTQELTLHPFFLASARPCGEERILPAPPSSSNEEPIRRQAEDLPAVDRLATLPREIVWMIFEHLTPGALIQMSRVTKSFRSVLRSKASERLWRNARLREGWKDLEAEGWNEMQYARFIEGRECEVCHEVASNSRRVKRSLRLRAIVCDECDLIVDAGDPRFETEYCYIHPDTYEHALYDQTFFLPDLLEQSGRLSQVDAQALRANNDSTAYSAYFKNRSAYMRKVANDADELDCVCSQSDAAMRHEAWRKYSKDTLTSFYSFAFLEEDDWWCWCSVTPWDDAELVAENIDEEIRRVDGFDAEDATEEEYGELFRIFEAEHDLHYEFPQSFRKYWDVDGDGFEEDEDCDAEDGPEADLYVKLSYQNKQERLRREEEVARQVRRDSLRPLYERIREETTQRQSSHFPTFDYFCGALEPIKRLWYAGKPDLASTHCPSDEHFLIRDACDAAHFEKVRLFLRITRAMINCDVTSVPKWVNVMLEYIDFRLKETTPSRVINQFYLSLGDVEMDPILARATALFRCGFCSRKLTYPSIAEHLVETHKAGPITAFAHVPSLAFRQAISDLLAEMYLPTTTSCEVLAKYRFNVEETSDSGVRMKLCDQSWEEVLAGKADCELPGKRRNVDGDKTDRNITAIHLRATSTAAAMNA